MSQKEEELRIIRQFALRNKSYNTSARWMLDPGLIQAHVQLLGRGSDQKKCLELCCGTGIIGKALGENGWPVTGIDLTPQMAAEADPFFPVNVANVEQMPFSENCFEAAVLRQSFMLVDGRRTLAEVRRVLKNEGVFLLSQSVPFGAGDRERYREVQWARHINMKEFYDSEALASVLEAGGFSILETRLLTIEESVNAWLAGAPELTDDLRSKIFNLINEAPAEYKSARNVHTREGELFENWNWILIKAQVRKQ